MHLTLRTAVLAAILLLAGCAQDVAAQASPPPTITADAGAIPDLAKLLQAALVDYPGVAFAIAGPSGAFWSGGAGIADIATNVPMTSGIPVSVYSVAKPMTATLAMTLVEKHQLDLDRPISALAGVPAPLASLTPRELLTHTSGIRHYRDGEWIPNARTSCQTPGQALTWFSADPLGPRGTYKYSSFGFALLSDVIQESSGSDFMGLMRERVFAPAGMTTASFWTPGMRRPPNGHEKSGRNFRVARQVDNSCKFGAGAIVASAGDLAKFGAALASGKLISAGSLRAMTESAKNNYGLGLGVGTLPDGTPIATHSGSAIGGTSAIAVDLSTGVSVGLVGNAEGPSLVDEAKAMLAMARANPAFAAPPPAAH